MAGEGTILPFRDGLSVSKLPIALPPPVVQATCPLVESWLLPR
jgi:hypothetical protein